MTEPDAAPCAKCRTFVATDERSCPQCGASVLVDLVATSVVDDSRVRYHLSRALGALAEGRVSPTAIQTSLAQGRGLVLVEVTRAAAEEGARITRESGFAARIQSAGAYRDPREQAGSSSRWWLVPAILGSLAVVGSGIWVAQRKAAPKAQDRSASASHPKLSPTQVAERGLAATVALRCGEKLGSGFFVDEERIVTNAHVLCGDDELTVKLASGQALSGTVEGVDERLDLAVVRATGAKAPSLPIGDAGELKVGEPLVMVGSPLGMEFTVHQASVSSLERHDLGVAFVQIDARVNPGNSGGPLVDERGRAVGVVTLKRSDAEGIAFAVPIDYLVTGRSSLLADLSREASPGFARMTSVAEGQSREEADKLASTGQRPGLIGAVAYGRTIEAKVLWPSAFEPVETQLSFALWRGTDRICSLSGEVARWVRIVGQDGASVMNPRGKAWLEENGFSSDLYGGVVQIDWSECPSEELTGAVDLELEGADQDASRVRFE